MHAASVRSFAGARIARWLRMTARGSKLAPLRTSFGLPCRRGSFGAGLEEGRAVQVLRWDIDAAVHDPPGRAEGADADDVPALGALLRLHADVNGAGPVPDPDLARGAGARPRDLVDDRALDGGGDRRADAGRACQRAVALAHRDHADGQVDALGRLIDPAGRAVARRWRHHHHLRLALRLQAARASIGTQPHHYGGVLADLFERGDERAVGIDILRELGGVRAQVGGAHEHQRVGRVDQRNLEGAAVGQGDRLADLAGRQQPLPERAARLQELQRDPGGRPRHAVDGVVALDLSPAIADRNMAEVELAGVDAQDPDGGHRLDGLDQPLVDGERADRGRHIAAGAQELDHRRLDVDLPEAEGHVGSGVRAGHPDDADLAQRGDAAAEAVDLAAVRIGAAEGGQDDRALCGVVVGREVGLAEQHRPARPATVEARRYGYLWHQRWSSGTNVSARGPTYFRRGRMIRFFANCSIALALQPTIRAEATKLVNRWSGKS